MAKMSVVDFNSKIDNIKYDDLEITQEVNICPHCKKGIQTVPLAYAYGKTKIYPTARHRRSLLTTNANTLGIICKCPICNELIYATYVDLGHQDFDDTYTFKWERKYIYPISHDRVKYEDIINEISPKFEQIYNQAKQAEEIGLNEICGMGYRKSLEFLIKDYAKRKNPNKTDTIEKTLLKSCIQTYIDNDKIKRCAVGAAYLGNDESHYIRRWEDKDLSDLKKLIEMTVYWIMYSETTENFTEEMELDK